MVSESDPLVMSFVYCDALTHELLDVVEDRRLESLIAYFMRFPLEVRKRVQGVVIDMYAPYASLIKKCFPHATIITDRFHVAQHLLRAMNTIRIEVMKGFKHDSKEYKLLKRYWKYILQPNHKRKSGYWYCRYLRKHVNAYEILDVMLGFSELLREQWEAFQNLYASFKNRDARLFFEGCENSKGIAHASLRTAIETFIRCKKSIQRAFETTLSNGPIEGINNKIKLIKRVSYGYRSFFSLRLRIMVCFKLTKKSGALTP